jgi:hypothetical protein
MTNSMVFNWISRMCYFLNMSALFLKHKELCIYILLRIMQGSKFSTVYHQISSLANKKAQFKVALKRYLITHSFYSVDEFLMFTDKS